MWHWLCQWLFSQLGLWLPGPREYVQPRRAGCAGRWSLGFSRLSCAPLKPGLQRNIELTYTQPYPAGTAGPTWLYPAGLAYNSHHRTICEMSDATRRNPHLPASNLFREETCRTDGDSLAAVVGIRDVAEHTELVSWFEE